MWKEEEKGNEVATAKTDGIADGLAIELARSLDKVALSFHKEIVNEKGYKIICKHVNIASSQALVA